MANNIYPTPNPEALQKALVRCMLKVRSDAQLDASALTASTGDDRNGSATYAESFTLPVSSDASSNACAIRTVVGTGADD